MYEKAESPSLALLNVALGMVAITGCYLFPMYLVGHWYGATLIWLGLAVLAIAMLRFTWYRNLSDT